MSYQEALEAAGAQVELFTEFGSYQGTWIARVNYQGNLVTLRATMEVARDVMRSRPNLDSVTRQSPTIRNVSRSSARVTCTDLSHWST